MKVFIWESVAELTTNWHSDGGVAVIAESLDEARKLLPSKCDAQTENPDLELECLGSVEPKAFIFPNAGCC